MLQLICPSSNWWWPLNFWQYQPPQCPEELLCTEDKVFEMLSSLDTKKANGWETFLPQCWDQLLQVLHTVSHCSLTNPSVQGKYPKAWKMSPIPKESDSTSVSNYRPVSVLSVISKLLERHMHSLISCHIETFYPIASHQWGFQPGKSAVSAQINVLHNWSLALDQRKEVAVVFFDLCKAFDSVPHGPLLDKLKSIGLSEYIIKWICSCLSKI